MLEDKLLIWKFKRGNCDALQSIYIKYKDDLLALAISLSRDKSLAEDVLHDVFVSFAEYAEKLQLRTSLKGYLSSCVANRIRNIKRSQSQQITQSFNAKHAGLGFQGPDRLAILAELSQQIELAIAQLPYEQQEVIFLHLQSGMKFKTIAKFQEVSINTIQSRYRYGLDKLRSILNGQVEK